MNRNVGMPHPQGRSALRVCIRLAACLLLTTLRTQAQDRQPVLNQLTGYWTLTDSEREHPVPFHFDCSVTYYDPIWRILFVQDGSGAAYIPDSETLRFSFDWGQRLDVVGQLLPPRKDIRFDHAEIRQTGTRKPVAVPAHGNVYDAGMYQNRYVSVEGLVDHVRREDATHVGLSLSVEGKSIVAWVLTGPDTNVPDLTEATIRIEGVYNGKFGPDGRISSLELLVQSMDHVFLLGHLRDDPRFNAPTVPIASLKDIGGEKLVHINGAFVGQHAGQGIVLRDESGQVEVESAQTRVPHEGERVDAVGFPVDLGARLRLARAVYRPVDAPVAPSGSFTDHTLRLAAQVMELSPKEAASSRPVKVSGVVTWCDGNTPFFFLQDTSGGMRVRCSKKDQVDNYPGRYVVVQGVTAMGAFAPEVVSDSCAKLSDLVVPIPEPISLEHALTGAEEANWVEMHGYLRRARRDGPLTRLELVTTGGEFEAVIPNAYDVSAYVGAIMGVQGACTAITDTQNRISGVRLWVPTKEQLQIEEAPLSDPFARPLRNLADLGRYNPSESFNRLLRFSGVVLRQSRGRTIELEEGGQSLRVFSQQRIPVEPGDRIDAVGLLAWQGGRYTLREAIYKKVSKEAPPAPMPAFASRPASAGLDGHLVTIVGTIVGVLRNPDQIWLTLQNDRFIFEADIDPDAAQNAGNRFAEGNVVSLTGVYDVVFDELGRPLRFRIDLRTPEDVAVIRSSPWLTAERVSALAFGLIVAVLLFIGWIAVLRRQVRRQTDQIRDQLSKEARMQTELQRASKLESVGLLAGGIAHDFNNLLTAVMGNLSLARLDSKMDPESAESLRDAEKAAARARDLTQQLLTFAKGGAPIQSAVLLPDVVREVAAFALRGTKVRCEFDIPADIWPANADKGQIAQVVQNIVINAMQAMPEGGVIQIFIRNDEVSDELKAVLAPGRYVRISFADQGSGIGASDLERIFDPYFTTKTTGSGLGLATVHSIIKKHLGHISVESAEGKGTTFHIWLPAATEKPKAAEGAESPVPPARGASSARVLFMDDEQPIRQVGAAILRRSGYDVVAVSGGAEAVRAYAEALGSARPFAVVILDLTIPGGMGGREALAELMQLDPSVKAIVSSGYSNDAILSDYRAHGFKGMVSKPYESGDLLRAVEHILNDA